MSPGNVALKQELANVTIRLDALPPHPQAASALQRDREALDLLRSAALESKASTMELDLAFHSSLEAEPASLIDPAFALRCAEQGVALTHRKAPAWLLSLTQAHRALGDTEQAKAAAKEGLALLPNSSANKNFRLRRLLELATN